MHIHMHFHFHRYSQLLFATTLVVLPLLYLAAQELLRWPVPNVDGRWLFLGIVGIIWLSLWITNQCIAVDTKFLGFTFSEPGPMTTRERRAWKLNGLAAGIGVLALMVSQYEPSFNIIAFSVAAGIAVVGIWHVLTALEWFFTLGCFCPYPRITPEYTSQPSSQNIRVSFDKLVQTTQTQREQTDASAQAKTDISMRLSNEAISALRKAKEKGYDVRFSPDKKSVILSSGNWATSLSSDAEIVNFGRGFRS